MAADDPKIETVILRHVGTRYLIFYKHALGETLVDASDDEFRDDYEIWKRAAQEHARDNAAEFIDLTDPLGDPL